MSRSSICFRSALQPQFSSISWSKNYQEKMIPLPSLFSMYYSEPFKCSNFDLVVDTYKMIHGDGCILLAFTFEDGSILWLEEEEEELILYDRNLQRLAKSQEPLQLEDDSKSLRLGSFGTLSEYSLSLQTTYFRAHSSLESITIYEKKINLYEETNDDTESY